MNRDVSFKQEMRRGPQAKRSEPDRAIEGSGNFAFGSQIAGSRHDASNEGYALLQL
jgi:hypothetical protein